jgi:hypothetical protein
MDDGRVGAFIKGRKCPLLVQHLIDHAQWVEFVWNCLLARTPKVRHWLAAVKLNGYARFDFNRIRPRDLRVG